MAPPSAHRGDIQGLRALAVLLVALGHAGVWFLEGGFVGVDVFFVLSGFLITGLLLSEARTHGSISLKRFYLRRARRILPAAVLTLLATEVAAFFLLNFLRAKEVMWDGVYAGFFLANFRFAERQTDYFAAAQPQSPLLHLWSLGVEEQFYLVWPALLSVVFLGSAALIGHRLRHRTLLGFVALAGVASLVWSVHQTAALAPAAYFSPLTRAWELALGGGVAVAATTLGRVQRGWKLAAGWAGLVAIALSAVAFSSDTPFPGYSALLPTMGAALVIFAGMTDTHHRRAVATLLDRAPMRYVGDRSYAFYLWHWPMLILAQQYLEYEPPLAVNLALLLVAFAVSIASYALVENPMRRMTWTPARAGIALGTASAAVIATTLLSLGALEQREQHFQLAAAPEPQFAVAIANETPRQDARPSAERALPAVVAAVEAARRGARIPSRLTPPIGDLLHERLPYYLPPGCVPVANSNQTSSKICPLGRTGSSRSIVVIGDSHAQMWLPAVLSVAQHDGWVVLPVLRPGCLPGEWLTDSVCSAWYRWATDQVRRLHPNVTIVGGMVGGSRGAAARGAERGILAMGRAVKPASGRVVVVGDAEGLMRSPVDCLLSRRASMARCTATWSPPWLQPYDRVAARSRQSGLGFIATRGWFCFERMCPPVIGRTIAYKDPHHITAAYAARLGAVFRAALRREIR